MRHVRLVVMMAVAMAVTACNGRHESLTSPGYGDAMLSGEVFVNGATPEGVEVSVIGTGMTTMLRADGMFAFAGVPENAILSFRREADGIESSLAVGTSSGSLLIELVGTTARKTSRRRSMGRGTGEAFQFEGVVRSAAADSIVVFTSKGEEVTIGLTPETVLRKGNRTLTVADLVVDARVHVKARKTGEAYSAIEVKLQEGSEKVEFEGTVASVNGSTLVVTTADGAVTVETTSSTQIRRSGKKIELSDVIVGSTVEVEGRRLGTTTVEAKKITVED